MNKLKKIIKPATGITAYTLGLTLGLSGLTGTIKLDKEVNVPNQYKEYTMDNTAVDDDEKITAHELSQTELITVDVTNGTASLDYLKYCTSLKRLILIIDNNSFTVLETLPEIDSLECIEIYSTSNTQTVFFDSENIQFLSKFPKLKVLHASCKNIYFGKNTLEQYNNLYYVNLFDLNYVDNCDIDFSKLTFLGYLNLDGAFAKDLPMLFSIKDYQTLSDANVNIELKFCVGDINDYFATCEELNKIVEELNIQPTDTDEQKCAKITAYLLERYTYDPEISEKLANDDMQGAIALTPDFYDEGYQTGLFKDTQICGNYAGTFSALAKLSGVEDYFVTSHNHVWNMVNINGENKYIDVTNLESEGISYYTENNELLLYIPPQVLITSGEGDILDLYMFNDSELEIFKAEEECYNALNLPEYNYIDQEELKTLSQQITEKGPSYPIIASIDALKENFMISFPISIWLYIKMKKLKENIVYNKKRKFTSKLSNDEICEIDNYIKEICNNSDSQVKVNEAIEQMKKCVVIILSKDQPPLYVAKSIYMLEHLINNKNIIKALRENNIWLNDIFDPKIIKAIEKLKFINPNNRNELINNSSSKSPIKPYAKRKKQ